MASVSEVQVARMALSNIGKGSKIESLTENSPEARECLLWFDTARQQALEAHNWSFARRRAALALSSEDAPEEEWAFRYIYPSECIATRYIENPLGVTAPAVPYEVELNGDGTQKTILTDQEDAVMVYTFDQQNPDLWTVHFTLTMSYFLAHHVAQALTGSSKLRTIMLGIATNLGKDAAGHDANSSQPRLPREADWITARTS